MKNKIVLFLFVVVCQTVFSGCSKDLLYLSYSLKSAGKNRNELRKVIHHYRYEDKDIEKLKAAKFLITNMTAHYSYRDTAAINSYYKSAISILGKGSNPDWERDTLRQISDTQYYGITEDIISDVQVIPFAETMYVFAQERVRLWNSGRKIQDFDLLIGCAAKAKGLTMVTHNVSHFEHIDGIAIEDWVN